MKQTINPKTLNNSKDMPTATTADTSMAKSLIKGIIPSPHEKSMSYPLILARHGNTALNEDGDKIRGWKDVPLSPKGQEEAKELGERLKKEDFDAIISSDLIRTKQTAEDISKATGKPIVAHTKGLRPWNAGIFQGQESNKIMSQMKEYIRNPDKKIPEGESFNEFKKRYLDEINHIKKMFPNKLICVVAHHRNNVVLDAWQKAGEKPDYELDEPTLMEKGIQPADFKKYQLKM